ncbi:cation/multidrug efflux pump [Chthonomonas calidirosea]|uniref:efflux RND transporter permease subunit n=1 Tax=Chthonomonas calidirosea TaxID=454171 RepID=UPI0006DD3EC7|nr:efflux RND transporter permease subunit [Chthonomonas calidirosea]CEK18418.1 cation/multidrug efflux pump [Chthonomonas calidirosea]
MNLSRFVSQNLKAILFVTIALCVIGVGVVGSFPVAILPEVTFPRLVVIAHAGERPIRMTEVALTRPIEQAIATVPGVIRIRSKTQRGDTEISVDFAWGTDMLTALELVNTQINQIRSSLPPETDVEVERMNPTVFPILGLSLQSKNLSQAQLWTLATYTLRPALSRVPGVALVEVQGGRIPEIAVDISPQRLMAYHLSLPEVEQAIANTNVFKSVGLLNRQFQQYQAIVSAEATDTDQLGRVVVAQRQGVPILLRQIAHIYPSVQDRTTIVTANGAESVLINIVRQPGANTVTVVNDVEQAIQQLKPTLPPGTQLHVFYDQSQLIKEAVGSVRDAVIIGSVLAVVVLMLFLGNLRATLVTAVIIPATVLITFLLMRLSGLTLNLMTLGALAVGIGLVIDDAIVVVENVFRHLTEGATRFDSIRLASSEIALPMISSTLTTVVVFLPLVLLQGVAGAFFTALAVTLTIALMVSLALALFVSPSLCAAFLKVRPGTPEHGRLFEKLIEGYKKGLQFCVRHPRWLAVAAGLLVVATIFFATHLGSDFMPSIDEGAFVLDYRTPPGTSLEETNRLLMQIEHILETTPEVKSFSRRTGTELGFAITEPNRGDFAVMLHSHRHRSIDEVIADVRDRIERQVPGVDIDFSQVLQDLIGDLSGAPAPIEVKLFGEDQNQLDSVARSVADKLAKIPGVVDVQNGVIEMGPELTVRVDPVKAGVVGLTPEDVANQVNAAMFGDVATQILQGERQIGVRVRLPEAYRSDKSAIEMLPIHTPDGYNVPLATLGTIQRVAGTVEITHENQRRMVSIEARLSGRDLGSVMKDVQALMRRTPLPAGITYELGGQYQSQQQSFRNLLEVLVLAVVLVYAVMLFQFGSFTSPTVLLLIMPLALFGVSFGLWATGTTLNVSSFMGAIMLVGIVVKNGILLLDQAQRAEREGLTPEEAVAQAGVIRIRPILMTTLTALLGLVPLAFGIGAGAQMQQPLAIAVIGGLSFSTIFTLVFAPTLYVVFRRYQLRLQANHEAPPPAELIEPIVEG